MINHRTTVKPYDHFLTFCLRTHFIFSSILSVFSALYFLSLPLKFLYCFSLPASFSCLSVTFNCFRSFFAVLFLFVCFGLHLLLLSLVGICFNLSLPFVLPYSLPLFSFPISPGFSKLPSLFYFPLFNNLYFKVCGIHTI